MRNNVGLSGLLVAGAFALVGWILGLAYVNTYHGCSSSAYPNGIPGCVVDYGLANYTALAGLLVGLAAVAATSGLAMKRRVRR